VKRGAQFAQGRVAQRAFVGPARAALAEKCFDKALRLMAAGALVSDDLEFQLDAETAGKNRFALWRAALQAVQSMPHLVLSGKEDSFAAIAFSPDSTHVVAGCGDHTAKIWEVASGAEVAVLRGHTDRVDCVAFSPDGSRVLTGSGGFFGSGDGTARVWDATTGAELAVLQGHERGVFSVAFSADGKLVLTGSDDKTARIWDSKTGTVLRVLSGHERGVCAAVFSPDGTLAITGSKDRTACIWKVASGVLAVTLSGHREDVCCVAVSPDGRLALTGDQGGTVHIWELPGETGISSFRIPTWGALRAVFSADAARILICVPDGTVRRWNWLPGKKLRGRVKSRPGRACWS
jgi:predicted NACHT family NTPase